MANTKISALPANVSPSGSEELVYASNNSNGKMTLNTMKTFVQPDLSGYATTADLATKQDRLVSGLNIKTVNGNNLLGSGDIDTSSSHTEYDYSTLIGPCSAGFHIPTNVELQTLITMGTTLGAWTDGQNFSKYLKAPYAGCCLVSGSIVSQGGAGYWWSCTASGTDQTYSINFHDSHAGVWTGLYRAYGASIRPFSDTIVVPDGTWTTIFDGSGTAPNAGIFYKSGDGLISISADGDTWLTIADKNLGATTVWEYGDVLSAANCGNYYQWGNNYGFSWSGGFTISTTLVDTTGYGPGNYYSSSTYIKTSPLGDWSTVQNDDLWGGVTGPGTVVYDIYNRIQLSGSNITIGGPYIGGIADTTLSGSYTLIAGADSHVGMEHYLYIPTQSSSYSITVGTGITNPFSLTLPSSTTKACLIKFYCNSSSTLVISDCKIAS